MLKLRLIPLIFASLVTVSSADLGYTPKQMEAKYGKPLYLPIASQKKIITQFELKNSNRVEQYLLFKNDDTSPIVSAFYDVKTAKCIWQSIALRDYFISDDLVLALAVDHFGKGCKVERRGDWKKKIGEQQFTVWTVNEKYNIVYDSEFNILHVFESDK